MHEINIKVKGNGTLNIGTADRLRLGTENEVNRVKLVFDVDSSIGGSYQYVKFYKKGSAHLFRVRDQELTVSKTILASPGIWLLSFISTDSGMVDNKITGEYAFISEPIEAVVCEGILQYTSLSEDAELVKKLIGVNVRELILPDYVEEIGDYFLYNSEANLYVELNDNLKSIGTYAFYSCIIGGLMYSDQCQLTTLKDYALYNVYFENELILPASITSWGKYVFKNSELLTIAFQKNSKLESLGSYALWENGACEIYLPDHLKTLSGNTYVIKNCKSLYYLWIPNTITTAIPANAIYGCDALDEIHLQAGFNISANFTNCTALTAQSMVAMFNALKDLRGESAKSLTLGSTNLAKLTSEQIAIATDKNWTIS